jgi:hypothetical protein
VHVTERVGHRRAFDLTADRTAGVIHEREISIWGFRGGSLRRLRK